MSFSIGDGKRGDLHVHVVGIPAWDATQYLYNSLYVYYALGYWREGMALFGLPLELLLLYGGKTLVATVLVLHTTLGSKILLVQSLLS